MEKSKFFNVKLYQRHVSRHLEQLAFFTVSSAVYDAVEDDEDNDRETLSDNGSNSSVGDMKTEAAVGGHGDTAGEMDSKTEPTERPIPEETDEWVTDNEEEETEMVRNSIKLKDAVGRDFGFPFKYCATWAGMEELINMSLFHDDVLGPDVRDGHYNLTGPDGKVISPTAWQTLIQPGWSITMRMRPMDKTPQPAEGVASSLSPEKLQVETQGPTRPPTGGSNLRE
ncbi:hypothetical protein OQA88_8912 [Cercophora sp. LCS_1]